MYPLGVYLASYYDWWRRRVAKVPFLWLVGLVVALGFLQFSVERLFGSSFAWVLLVAVIAVSPGVWVALLATRNGFLKKVNPLKEVEDQKAMAKKLINEFAKKQSK